MDRLPPNVTSARGWKDDSRSQKAIALTGPVNVTPECVFEDCSDTSDTVYMDTPGPIIEELVEFDVDLQHQEQPLVPSIEGNPESSVYLLLCARFGYIGDLPKPCDRAGAPIKGGHPVSKFPYDVCVDVDREAWLPDDWAQVIRELPLGPQVGWLSPRGVWYSNRDVIEAALGRRLARTSVTSGSRQGASFGNGTAEIPSEYNRLMAQSVRRARQIELETMVRVSGADVCKRRRRT